MPNFQKRRTSFSARPCLACKGHKGQAKVCLRGVFCEAQFEFVVYTWLMFPSFLFFYVFSLFSARCNIYISRLCYDVSDHLSVCLSVCDVRLCIVVKGCDGSWISLHAWIDGCLCYLLRMPHPDRRMGWCQDLWWKTGGMEKLVIVAISLILLIFYRWTVSMWRICLCEQYWNFFSNLGRKCIIYLKNGLC